MNVTVPWRDVELIAERLAYLAQDGKIEVIYYGGGVARKVVSEYGDWIQTETGRVYRKPLSVREGVPSVEL